MSSAVFSPEKSRFALPVYIAVTLVLAALCFGDRGPAVFDPSRPRRSRRPLQRGLGLYGQHGIDSLAKLKEALDAGALQKIKGMGPKML